MVRNIHFLIRYVLENLQSSGKIPRFEKMKFEIGRFYF